MLTAYDSSFAPLLEKAGIDIILVGDSMANVVLGMEATKEIDFQEIINHTRAVVQATSVVPVIGDMPYAAYQFLAQVKPHDRAGQQKALAQLVANAKRLVNESGCQAVKIEWFPAALETAEAIVKAGIPLMGHIGYTPQLQDQFGSKIVQGKDLESARQLVKQAVALEKTGCFALVLECLPWQLSQVITDQLSIPTIGIGAGPYCDGQVLVLYDMLGLSCRFKPKFVKEYATLRDQITEAVAAYCREVRDSVYPDNAHNYALKSADWDRIKAELKLFFTE